MINKIIDGIVVAINSEFGDDYEIYTKAVEQGLKEPCFSVLCINPTIEQSFGRRFFRTQQFCIHYHPSSAEPRIESNAVMERLYSILEIITVGGDLTRGAKMKAEFDEGVLHFFVNYDFYVREDNDEDITMEDLDYNTGLKG